MIRKADKQDLQAIWEVYHDAQDFMRQTGNPNQWGNFYPTDEMLEGDIEHDRLYVIIREGLICGVFFFDLGPDPWYALIDDGQWISDQTYGVIHRVAARKGHKGIFKECLDFAWGKIQHLRIDTHEDNKVMQHVLEKYGFQRCGIVYVHERKSPRIAFEKI
jgi:RimJ/RimL family protein N-acetyltransferase